MAIVNVSLSLDVDLLSRARQVAGRRGLSALVNDALRIKLQHERIRVLLASMDVEFGPMPTQELERARKKWPAPSATKRKSHRSA